MDHFIIDNRKYNLKEHLKSILKETTSLRISTGYFYLEGYDILKEDLPEDPPEDFLKLLIGIEADHPALREIGMGYKLKEFIASSLEKRKLDFLSYKALKDLHSLIADKKARVKFYIGNNSPDKIKTIEDVKNLHCFLHAKAYITDKEAIVGSSNFTAPGLLFNAELNVVIKEPQQINLLKNWFDQIWESEATEITPEVDDIIIEIIKKKEKNQPQDAFVDLEELYRFIVYEYFDGEISKPKDILAEFQKVGVINIKEKFKQFGGALLADPVGLGKTYIASEIAQDYLRRGKKILFVLPPKLFKQWKEILIEDFHFPEDRYVNLIDKKDDTFLWAFLSHGKLPYIEKEAPELIDYIRENFDLIIIDEAHHFRSSGLKTGKTKSYRVLEKFKRRGDPEKDNFILLITATPLNNRPQDIANLIRLFATDARVKSVLSASLDAFQRYDILKTKIRRGEEDVSKFNELAQYAQEMKTIIDATMLLRMRKYLEQKYKEIKIQNRVVKFRDPKPQKYSYEITDEFKKIIDDIPYFIAELNVPHLRILNPVGRNLEKIYKVILYKRLESSLYAYFKSLQNLKNREKLLIDSLRSQSIKDYIKDYIEKHLESEEEDEVDISLIDEEVDEIFEKLKEEYGTQDEEELKSKIIKEATEDIEKINKQLNGLTSHLKNKDDPFSFKDTADPKIISLINLIREIANSKDTSSKTIIFTEYIDTAEYLFERLSSKNVFGDELTIEKVHGEDSKDALKKIKLFAPNANKYQLLPGEKEIDILISTDTLSEGVNLQDAYFVINYDLPWNPMRIVQRIGRVNRINVDHDITVYNIVAPGETEQDNPLLRVLGILQSKIEDIAEIIGQEFPILSPDDPINIKTIGEKIKQIEKSSSGDLEIFTLAEELKKLYEEKGIEDDSIGKLNLMEILARRGLLNEADYDKLKAKWEEIKKKNASLYSLRENGSLLFAFFELQASYKKLNQARKIRNMLFITSINNDEPVISKPIYLFLLDDFQLDFLSNKSLPLSIFSSKEVISSKKEKIIEEAEKEKVNEEEKMKKAAFSRDSRKDLEYILGIERIIKGHPQEDKIKMCLYALSNIRDLLKNTLSEMFPSTDWNKEKILKTLSQISTQQELFQNKKKIFIESLLQKLEKNPDVEILLRDKQLKLLAWGLI